MMKCEQCKPMLDQFDDGELSQAVARDVSAHLAACSACDRHYQALRREQKLYQQYLLEIESTPTLWDGLRSKIVELNAANANRRGGRLFRGVTPSFSTTRFNFALQASLALIIVGITIGIVRYMTARDTPHQPENAQRESGVRVVQPFSVSTPTPSQIVRHDQPRTSSKSELKRGWDPTKGTSKNGLMARNSGPRNIDTERQSQISTRTPVMRDVRTAERQYLTALRVLSSDFEHRRAQFEPVELIRLESALAQLDRTIADTRRAVNRHPDDPILVQYMMTAYAKKVEVLRQLSS
jgi:putative zinc finger protein